MKTEKQEKSEFIFALGIVIVCILVIAFDQLIKDITNALFNCVLLIVIWIAAESASPSKETSSEIEMSPE